MQEIKLPAPGDGKSPWVSAEEAAEFLGGIHPNTLEAGVARLGWVQVKKIGRGWKYDREDVAAIAFLIRRGAISEEIFADVKEGLAATRKDSKRQTDKVDE